MNPNEIQRLPMNRSRVLQSKQLVVSFGFSLVEIAVVLFIVTLLLGGVTQYITVQLTAAKVANTRSKQEAIKAALINFIARNNRLPCPAISTIATGFPGDGIEAPQVLTTNCVGTIGADAAFASFIISDPPASLPIVASGAVPWVSLGLTQETSLDGYANRFTYVVTYAATQLTSVTVSGMTGAITVHDTTPTLWGAINAVPPGNQTNDCRANKSVVYVPATNPCSAVVGILSSGTDGFGAFSNSGVQIPFPATVLGLDAKENSDGNSKIVAKNFSNIPANPFDDIVLALTPNDLLISLTNNASIQDARAATNSAMTGIKNSIAGTIAATMVATPVPTSLLDARNNDCTLGGAPTIDPPNSCTYYTRFTYTLASAPFPAGYTVETNGAGGIAFTAPFSCLLPCIQNRALISAIFPALVNSPARVDPWGTEFQYVLFNAAPTLILTSPAGALDSADTVAYRVLSFGPDRLPNTIDDVWSDVSFGGIRQQVPTK